MASLSFQHVYKKYEGGVVAVSDFNLDVADKEFVILVGPSGCGKSTTLRMLAGLEDISEGEIYIDDRCVNDVLPKDRDIAMVFQNYALYPHMSVRDNMAFALKLRKMPKDEINRRVQEAAKILEIEHLLDRKPKALSGGQRQRVALGRAIVRDPKVFLMDEPLSNLDAKLRVQMRVEITKLHHRLKTTFVYVTHDQTEAMTMGDRIVVMKDGFIQQVDSPATLYEQPRNVFVATFLGSPQMNIFDAELVKDGALGISFGAGHAAAFSNVKAAQLANHDYIGKEVLFGIRPENIKLGSKGIRARVDVVEHLGSETILYTQVEGVKLEDKDLNNEGKTPSIIVKIPTNHDIVEGMDVYLDFDMEKSHLFDKATKQSIMGVPDVNRFPCRVEDGSLIVNETVLALPDSVKAKFFDFSVRDLAEIRIPANDVSLEEMPESIGIDVDVDFAVVGSDNVAVYGKTALKEDHFVFRLKDTNVKAGDKLVVYVPFNAITFNGADGLRLNSREKVSENVCSCLVETKNGATTVKFGKNKLVYDDLGVADGEYTLKLKSDKIGFMYDKKYAKKNKVEYVEYPNAVKAKAYDEDMLGKKNAVFCSVSGFPDYVTAVLPADFSVYKMPVFKLVIEKDAFELIAK